MDFFRKRRNAVLISVAVILLSTVFGVHRSLGPKVREVEDSFDVGVYDAAAGYRLPAAHRQLENRCAASLNLYTVAGDYTAAAQQAEALRQARGELQDALDRDAPLALLYDLNEELESRFQALYVALLPLADAAAQADMETDAGRMENAARLLRESGYNELARAFNRETMGIFPTNILKRIAFVEDAELFE